MQGQAKRVAIWMMRSVILCSLLTAIPLSLHAEGPMAFKGTVTRMRVINCTIGKSFLTAMSGVPVVSRCPEYTILSNKVVYVVLGSRPDEFIPLAENIDFLIRKNELLTFSDDEKTRSRFVIQQMILRADWEREEQRREMATRVPDRAATYERNPIRNAMASGR